MIGDGVELLRYEDLVDDVDEPESESWSESVAAASASIVNGSGLVAMLPLLFELSLNSCC